ncbi:CYTH domain-containing protein [Streptomyces jumonjinensis]|uniref:CYTH domain-containing protein n=1 Tax=Streptomyces jumonjinensis TaxID=1945 RepID=A0A646KRF8_STRJU|nr:CYTH domain-containing protein [Streptomyces jumonjinensis]MQT04658.1 CYTH domain-containing protein [Streptomyces jumonjinensis]
MQVEIERKFLIQQDDAYRDLPAVPVRQGYLARGSDAEARIRSEGTDLSLTVKKGSGLERLEFEVTIDREQFDALWPATEGCRVRKARRAVPLAGGRTAYVDVFEGHLAGLITAEVEFPDRRGAASFEPPAWFGAEVTGDKRYSNQVLSSEGLPR